MRLSVSLTALVALVVYLAAPAPSVNAQPDIPADGPSFSVSYDHHRVVRVNIKCEEHLKTLTEHEGSLRFDYLTFQRTVGGHVDIRTPKNYAKFQELHLDHEMLIDNLQTLIDQEREENERYQQEWETMNQNKMFNNGQVMDAFASADDWFSAYHSFEDNKAWLNTQVKNHASIASSFSAGKSYEGRDLTGIKIGSGSKNVVLTGLQHAREWASIPPIQYTIDQLLSQSDPRAARYLKNYTFHIIPIMNPDGYEYSRNVDRNWHKSRCPSPPDELCRDPGVDLNLNWGYKWGGDGSSGYPCDDIYRGPEPFSEPETAGVVKYLKSLQKIDLLIDVHSFGERFWMYPFSYDNGVNQSYKLLDSLAKKAAQAAMEATGTRKLWLDATRFCRILTGLCTRRSSRQNIF